MLQALLSPICNNIRLKTFYGNQFQQIRRSINALENLKRSQENLTSFHEEKILRKGLKKIRKSVQEKHKKNSRELQE